jgi:hypothetical protein
VGFCSCVRGFELADLGPDLDQDISEQPEQRMIADTSEHSVTLN